MAPNRRGLALIVGSIAFCLANGADAGPEGGAVQIQPTPTVNWRAFSTPKSGAPTFNQPTSSSVSLNRVVGASPTRIFGNLTSNGRVVLINQSGVRFGGVSSIPTPISVQGVTAGASSPPTAISVQGVTAGANAPLGVKTTVAPVMVSTPVATQGFVTSPTGTLVLR